MKISQSISFNQEILNLKLNRVVRTESRIFSLSPLLDPQGILRIDSRISYFSHLNLSNKPILLDAKDRYTILLIKDYHEKFYHASHETVLNELRQWYWIIGLRHALKRIVAACTICKFLRGKPIQPRMSVPCPKRD